MKLWQNQHVLVIGGAPAAREQWSGIVADKTISCNRCLEFMRPDAYWLSDPNAIEAFYPLYMAYDGEIISNADIGKPTTRWPYLNAGLRYHGRSSGICCMRVALERGAGKLSVIGFHGHRPDDWVTGADGKPMLQYGRDAEQRNKVMEASFADMAANYPRVEVDFYGPTLMKVPENWRLL